MPMAVLLIDDRLSMIEPENGQRTAKRPKKRKVVSLRALSCPDRSSESSRLLDSTQLVV
jgi:hypothetical protein